MVQAIKWILVRLKWVVWGYRSLLVFGFLAALFGYGPLAARMSWLSSFEAWLANHVAHPITAAFLGGLILSTWLIPDAWKWWKKHFSSASRAILKLLGPELYQHAAWMHTNRWRVTVHNSGLVGARNVKMRLLEIIPRPRYGTWTADYPYPVNPLIGQSTDIKINPGDKEQFEIVAGWPNSEGHIYTEGLDTKDTRRNLIQIEPDEQWEMRYEVVAENADTIKFSLEMCVEDKSITVKRKS